MKTFRLSQINPWVILTLLLVLRLPVLTGVPMIWQNTPWLEPLFQIATYALTGLFLWVQRGSLQKYHITRLAVWMILLFKPLSTVILRIWGFSTSLAFPNWGALCIWAVAVLLGVAFWRTGWLGLAKTTRADWLWLGVGAAAGAITSGVFTLLLLPWGKPAAGQSCQVDLSFLLAFSYQLGYAAVDEEPLFRGLLWGQLRQAGWRDHWAWLLQAGLFTLGHLYLLQNAALPFLVATFCFALIAGGLAWRSRSIAASMAAHSVYNSVSQVISCLVAGA